MKRHQKIAALELLYRIIQQRGSAIITTHGRSMDPWIPDNSLVKIKSVDSGLRTGMVVAVRDGERLLVHRIVKIVSNNGFITKADNLPFIDGLWKNDFVLGTVVSVVSNDGDELPFPQGELFTKFLARISLIYGRLFYTLDVMLQSILRIGCSIIHCNADINHLSSRFEILSAIIFKTVQGFIRINFHIISKFKR
ncbi:MAG: S24/S26 family peptidase [Candidatus Hatepunaea meridiana]|nr:S24/S26 family peptidase [Candidatus Hatepunaea meridiana]